VATRQPNAMTPAEKGDGGPCLALTSRVEEAPNTFHAHLHYKVQRQRCSLQGLPLMVQAIRALQHSLPQVHGVCQQQLRDGPSGGSQGMVG